RADAVRGGGRGGRRWIDVAGGPARAHTTYRGQTRADATPGRGGAFALQDYGRRGSGSVRRARRADPAIERDGRTQRRALVASWQWAAFARAVRARVYVHCRRWRRLGRHDWSTWSAATGPRRRARRNLAPCHSR